MISNRDLFEPTIHDNTATNCREVWVNGKCTRYCRKNALAPHAVWEEMRPAWGHYPDISCNTQQAA